jgi:hypothetical protein
MTALLVRPGQLSPPSVPARPSATVFLRGLLGRVAGLLAAVVALNYLVNPFGVYATRLFEPIALSTRRPKLQLHAQRRPAPTIVALGSSRSFTLEPAYLEARTSRPAFNAAVHAAGPRDYLGLARCFAARHAFPSVLVVGLGVEQLLNEGRPVERNDAFADCARGERAPLARLLRAHSGLLTLEETAASVRVVGLALFGRPAPLYAFDADGMLRSSAPGPLLHAVDASLAGNWRPGLFDHQALNTGIVGQVRELLELSRRHGTKVIVYLPPYHPKALARYRAESRFALLHAQLLEQLAAWTTQYPMRFYDFTDPGSFGGRAEMFYDASHPREDAYRLMLDAMLADLT